MATILVVEDEKSLQDVYKLILSAKGHSVLTANNGIEGLELLRAKQPDVMLLDVFMPVMDGKEVLRNIDKADYPNTHIIMYSNLSDPDTEAEVLANGAEKFVLKSSMAPQDLVDLINSLTK